MVHYLLDSLMIILLGTASVSHQEDEVTRLTETIQSELHGVNHGELSPMRMQVLGAD